MEIALRFLPPSWEVALLTKSGEPLYRFLLGELKWPNNVQLDIQNWDLIRSEEPGNIKCVLMVLKLICALKFSHALGL